MLILYVYTYINIYSYALAYFEVRFGGDLMRKLIPSHIHTFTHANIRT